MKRKCWELLDEKSCWEKREREREREKEEEVALIATAGEGRSPFSYFLNFHRIEALGPRETIKPLRILIFE